MQNAGITFLPVYYGDVMGNPSGGLRQGAVTDGGIDLILDLDLARMSDNAVDDLIIHTNALYVYGPNISITDVGDFSITNNVAVYNSLRLQELWIEKGFWDKYLSLRVGNIAIDYEYFQSASAYLFINATFGALNLISANVPNAPVYPVASPGVSLKVQPTPNFYAMAGVFGMDSKSNWAINNQNGTLFALNSKSGMLIMSELGYLLNPSPKDCDLEGTYRVGSFIHTADYKTWDSRAQAIMGTGPLRSAGTNYGIYGVMDQQIYRNEKQIITLFGHSGWAPSNVNFVDYYVDGGFTFTGFIPGRDKDVAGLAMTHSHVSHSFSDAMVSLGNHPFTAETAIEATYKVQLTPWWFVQPDVQYVISPGGVDTPNALVLGLRTVITF